MNKYLKICLGIFIYEVLMGIFRARRRLTRYKEADARSKEIGKPLLVVGDPTPSTGQLMIGGETYGCGDVCVDIIGCPTCENSVKNDILSHLKTLPDNSYVIYISGVLAYVDYGKDGLQELKQEIARVSGDFENNFFLVYIEPYTLTALVYINPKCEVAFSHNLIISKDCWINVR